MFNISLDKGMRRVKEEGRTLRLRQTLESFGWLANQGIKWQIDGDASHTSQAQKAQRRGVNSSPTPKGKAIHVSVAEGAGTHTLSLIKGSNESSMLNKQDFNDIKFTRSCIPFLRISQVITRLSTIHSLSSFLISRRTSC